MSAPPDPFAEAAVANEPGLKVDEMRRLQRDRAARRDHQPMPEGGLFDEVARRQQDLF